MERSKADTRRTAWPSAPRTSSATPTMLRVVQGPQNIRLDLDKYLSSVWSRDGHIAVGQALGVLLPVPLPAPAGRALGARVRHPGGLRLRWSGSRTASRSHPATTRATGRYAGLAIPQENTAAQITDTTLLVQPDRAVAQRERNEPSRSRRGGRGGAGRRRSTGPRGGTGSGATGNRWRATGSAADRTLAASGARWIVPARRDRPLPATGPTHSPRPQEHPLLRHRPPGPRALRPRPQPPVPGGHPAPRRPRRREPGDHRRDPARSRRTATPHDKTRIVSENARTLKFASPASRIDDAVTADRKGRHDRTEAALPEVAAPAPCRSFQARFRGLGTQNGHSYPPARRGSRCGVRQMRAAISAEAGPCRYVSGSGPALDDGSPLALPYWASGFRASGNYAEG